MCDVFSQDFSFLLFMLFIFAFKILEINARREAGGGRACHLKNAQLFVKQYRHYLSRCVFFNYLKRCVNCLKTSYYLHPASNRLFIYPDPFNSIVCAGALLLSLTRLAKYAKPTKRACVTGARTNNTFQVRKIVCGSVVAAVSCTKNISVSVFINAAHVTTCCNEPVRRSCAVFSSKTARFAPV